MTFDNDESVSTQDDSVEVSGNLAVKRKREKKPVVLVSKEDTVKAIKLETAAIGTASQALTRLLQSLASSVNNNVDVTIGHKKDAQAVLASIEEMEESTKRVLALVVARCYAQLKE